jgi:hypothetical protein
MAALEIRALHVCVESRELIRELVALLARLEMRPESAVLERSVKLYAGQSAQFIRYIQLPPARYRRAGI